jgi:hypothetical protein
MIKEDFCFVIMPFEEKISEVYTAAIKPAVESKDLRCVRADEVEESGNIVRSVVEYISKAKIIIADLTNRNPNVFYELGIAHSLGNNTIVIAQFADQVPFDVKPYQVIIYQDSMKGGTELRRSIQNKIDNLTAWSNKSNNPVQDFLPEKLISSGLYNTVTAELENARKKLLAAQNEQQDFETLKRENNELKQKYAVAWEKAKELEILQKLLGPAFMDGQKTSQEEKPEFISSVQQVMERVQKEGEVSIDVASTQDDGKKKRIKFTKIN